MLGFWPLLHSASQRWIRLGASGYLRHKLPKLKLAGYDAGVLVQGPRIYGVGSVAKGWKSGQGRHRAMKTAMPNEVANACKPCIFETTGANVPLVLLLWFRHDLAAAFCRGACGSKPQVFCLELNRNLRAVELCVET